MTALRPLPPELAGLPFSVSKATGVTRSRLRAADLSRPFHGARLPSAAASDHFARCLAATLVCHPRAFVFGVSAAALHGMPTPFMPSEHHPIEIGVPDPLRAVRRRGIRGRSMRVADDDIVTRDGMRLTSCERTWCDLAETLTVPELVAAGDWLLRSLTSTRARLEDSVARHPARHGSRRLTTAVALLEPAAESPKESETRAILHLAGLPAPEVNPAVRDEYGRFVARVDLLFRDYGEVLEYQGDHHRTDIVQWRRDRARESELESLGLHVTEITNADLAAPRALVERIARNLRRRGWSGELRFSRQFPPDRSNTHARPTS